MDEKSLKWLEEEPQGITTINDLKRTQKDLPVQILVKNLPPGITQTGIRNLFLCIGVPLQIDFSPSRNRAIVEFKSLNQAELAVRDLNREPPYNLTVSLYTSSSNKSANVFNAYQSVCQNSIVELKPGERFVKEEISLEDSKVNECKIIHTSDRRRSEKINYDVSYKIHMRKCDFKIKGTNSISFGRGYFYSGEESCPVGGLEKYSIDSGDIDEDFFRSEFYCENCNSSTTKICSTCSTPYCSKTCLFGSLIHRKSNCLLREDETTEQKLSTQTQDMNIEEIKSPCDVIVTCFTSLKTVFIRPVSNAWNDKFCRMCNDIMIAVVEGRRVDEPLEIGALCIAKYYEDNCYYRAEICLIGNEKVKVFFLDFGNFQETEIEDLIHMPSKLREIPRFATAVNLINIPDGTSSEAVMYFNKLTAESVPLILKFEESYMNGVTLIEKESMDCVNERVQNYILPSWQKDISVLSKIGEVFFVDSLLNQTLNIGQTYNASLSFIDKHEFESRGIFWITLPEEDYYLYVNGELKDRILEYCEFLKDDCYLPRDNELCLAKEEGEWCRCFNIQSHRTTCYLSFIDDGKTALVETANIRKMISDFLLAPQQAIRCVLSEESVLKENPALRLKAFELLQSKAKEIISSVVVKQFLNDSYYLEIPILQGLSDVE